MMKSKTARFGAFLATLGMSATLVGAATASTGAYFSNTRQGHVGGTMGSIKVTTYGGTGTDSADFSFENMLPGEPQTAAVQYQNTGRNAEDVYVVFNDAAKLHDLNQLGRYGEVHLTSNSTEIFASQNLNDNATSCPVGSGDPACAPLPAMLKLADNLAAGSSVQGMAFTFKWQDAPYSLSNTYNIDGATGPTALDLPYQIVAVQHGRQP